MLIIIKMLIRLIRKKLLIRKILCKRLILIILRRLEEGKTHRMCKNNIREGRNNRKIVIERA
jgi:hypothetical protein